MSETSYSVSEAAGLLEVQSHVLRYWEEELCLPIGRNEMGHRYYTRCDIQVFMGIKELKKKGLSLKEISGLIPFFYDKKEEKKKASAIAVPALHAYQKPVNEGTKLASISEKPERGMSAKQQRRLRRKKNKELVKQKAAALQAEKQKNEQKSMPDVHPVQNVLPDSFMEIVDRLVRERMKVVHSGEERFKQLDERIRTCQRSRREVAASMEKEKKGSEKFFARRKAKH